MISIILPTYNSIEFLEERVDTILNQTISDWECIVIDGNSTDGTWEYLNAIALIDVRFKMFQFTPKGVYNAWNIGVKKSKGDYIYFATSDDTMKLNCLEEFLKGFELAPTSSIAHCCLSIIDENYKPIKNMNWKSFPAQQYFEDLTNRYHIRKAPLVGVLYATHQTIIHSFTQVLIKKEVFNQIGYFLENKGPQADLEWGMRAGFIVDIVHVPLDLATWRVHDNQLTLLHSTRKSNKEIIELMCSALKTSKYKSLNNSLIKTILFFTRWNTIKQTSILRKLTSFNYYKLRSKFIFDSKLSIAIKSRKSYHLFLIDRIMNNKEVNLIEEL